MNARLSLRLQPLYMLRVEILRVRQVIVNLLNRVYTQMWVVLTNIHIEDYVKTLRCCGTFIIYYETVALTILINI